MYFKEESGITYELDVIDDPTNANYSGRLQVPSDDSGITTAVGYDFGNRTKEVVKQDLQEAGIDGATADVLSNGAGLKGAAATQFLQVCNLLIPNSGLRIETGAQLPNLLKNYENTFGAIAHVTHKTKTLI